MSGVLLGSAVIGTVGGWALNKYGGSGGGGGGGGGMSNTQRDLLGALSFKADPLVEKTQDFLFPYGTDIMKGKIDPYYAPIGERGGDEFNKMLSQVLGDTEEKVYGAGARAGIRGPRLASSMARETGRISTEMNFKDYMRMLKGRKWLFGQGRGITEGVRSAALTNQSQLNTMEAAKAGISANFATGAKEASALKEAQEAQYWSDISEGITGGITALGSASSTKGAGQSFAAGKGGYAYPRYNATAVDLGY